MLLGYRNKTKPRRTVCKDFFSPFLPWGIRMFQTPSFSFLFYFFSGQTNPSMLEDNHHLRACGDWPKLTRVRRLHEWH